MDIFSGLRPSCGTGPTPNRKCSNSWSFNFTSSKPFGVSTETHCGDKLTDARGFTRVQGQNF